MIQLSKRLEDVPVGFPIAPEGSYPARISSAEQQESNAGDAFLVVGLTPTVPIDCSVDNKPVRVEANSRELFRWWVSLTENEAKKLTLSNLRRLAEAANQPLGDTFDEKACIGCNVIVKVSVGSSRTTGKPVQNVDGVYRPA